MEWLDQAAAGRLGATEYDLIFLDAPTFSNSKSMRAELDLQRDHAALIRKTAGLLSPDGILLFATNNRHFKLDPALLHELNVEDVTKQTIPPDFSRNPRIHACFRITLTEEGQLTAAARALARTAPKTQAVPRPIRPVDGMSPTSGPRPASPTKPRPPRPPRKPGAPGGPRGDRGD
jgi:hypothetical protein